MLRCLGGIRVLAPLNTPFHACRAKNINKLIQLRYSNSASSRMVHEAAAGAGEAQHTSSTIHSAGQQQQQSTEEVLLQYIVLRRDLWTELGWPLGSVVAQGAHAATAALWLSRDTPTTQAYCALDSLDHMHKVVLEVKGDTQLRALAEKLAAAGVAHKLWVEQPEDFATCLATAPAPKSIVQPHMKKLKLCKGT